VTASDTKIRNERIADLLECALDDLDEVCETLNDSGVTCAGCGREKKLFWSEAQAKEILLAAMTRIQTAARKLKVPLAEPESADGTLGAEEKGGTNGERP
jgi:predicted Fe-S protein YdhL (DUF1289 family)